MNIPLLHVIRPGIVHFMAFPATIKGEGPILETCRQILADDYFGVIEISWIKDPAIRAQVKAMIASAGVEAKYGAQPRLLTQKLDLNSADEAMRQRAVAVFVDVFHCGRSPAEANNSSVRAASSGSIFDRA